MLQRTLGVAKEVIINWGWAKHLQVPGIVARGIGFLGIGQAGGAVSNFRLAQYVFLT